MALFLLTDLKPEVLFTTESRGRQGNLRQVVIILSHSRQCRGLKTSLIFPCQGPNTIIDYISHTSFCLRFLKLRLLPSDQKIFVTSNDDDDDDDDNDDDDDDDDDDDYDDSGVDNEHSVDEVFVYSQ